VWFCKARHAIFVANSSRISSVNVYCGNLETISFPKCSLWRVNFAARTENTEPIMLDVIAWSWSRNRELFHSLGSALCGLRLAPCATPTISSGTLSLSRLLYLFFLGEGVVRRARANKTESPQKITTIMWYWPERARHSNLAKVGPSSRRRQLPLASSVGLFSLSSRWAHAQCQPTTQPARAVYNF